MVNSCLKIQMTRPCHLLPTVLLMPYHIQSIRTSTKSRHQEMSTQTLMHVLNNCSVSLKTNRYTWHHNSVLAALVEYIKRNLADSWQITADLPGRVYSLPSGLGAITA